MITKFSSKGRKRVIIVLRTSLRAYSFKRYSNLTSVEEVISKTVFLGKDLQEGTRTNSEKTAAINEYRRGDDKDLFLKHLVLWSDRKERKNSFRWVYRKSPFFEMITGVAIKKTWSYRVKQVGFRLPYFFEGTTMRDSDSRTCTNCSTKIDYYVC